MQCLAIYPVNDPYGWIPGLFLFILTLFLIVCAVRSKSPSSRTVCIGAAFLCFCLTIAVSLPAVARVREPAAKIQAANNLKQIGLALHNYHVDHDHFPAQAIYSNDGKPLLSWRVAVLPYVEEEELYKQFHLDEPWDSPHNKKLLEEMPYVYVHPKDEHETTKAGLTRFLAFVSADKTIRTGISSDPMQPTRMKDITDGTDRTFLIAEAANPVPWTKPEDLPADATVAHLANIYEVRGTQILFADGSVRFFDPSELTNIRLKHAIRIDDGE